MILGRVTGSIVSTIHHPIVAGRKLLAHSLLPRLDGDLRTLLDAGTRFGSCAAFEPAGAEYPEEVACSWDA